MKSRTRATAGRKGDETQTYLASSPEVEQISGKYFGPEKSSSESYDPAIARRLWEVSAQMTGVGA